MTRERRATCGTSQNILERHPDHTAKSLAPRKLTILCLLRQIDVHVQVADSTSFWQSGLDTVTHTHTLSLSLSLLSPCMCSRIN